MRRCIFSFFVVLSLAVPFSQAQSRSSEEKQILPLIQEQMLAANAHDTNRFLAFYLHSDDLIFVVDGEIIRGWSRLREQQLKWWLNGKSDDVYTQPVQPEFMHLDAQSVLVTQQLAAHRNVPAEKSTDHRFVVTTIWRNSPTGWHIVYCHESWAP